MKMQLARWIKVGALAVLTLCIPLTGAHAGRLTWEVKGTLEVIGTDSITVNGSSYTLTPTTRYERNDQYTTIDAFTVGDYVEVKFITDRSVIKLENKQYRGGRNPATPIPGAPNPVATPQASRYRIALSPLGASTARGRAEASHKAYQSKFSLEVKIPRNTIPLATTNAEAAGLTIQATISRDGSDIATCTTRFDRKRRQVSVYEFETEMESKTRYGVTRVRSKKGSCTLADGTIALPTVQAGDNITISETSAGEFLTGTF